ncbi:NAD(P)-dependent oxidoreductase [Orrella sp. JC864]|uniref:NAD(P)-dependent oxidoreductase n=1 Tax=Orrella sp. JC864 TaxID=3120298 RepID=UPI0012BCD538
MKQKIGLIGVGLMGHGIARNLVKHGYPLTVQDHPGNQPLDELKAGGATTQASARAVAEHSDVVILCVTGSPEVEAVLQAEDGVLKGLRPGAIVIDCSTALPESTRRMAQAVQAAQGRFLDAPMTRTVKDAHEGRLNLLVGGDAQLLEEVRPILACFAENITHAGPVGAGHQMKLLHNYVSLGSVALLAEAAACAQGAGIAPQVLIDVLGKGGGRGVALERIGPYLLSGDTSGLHFFMSNAAKDLGYYTQMARDGQAEHGIADSVSAAYAKGVEKLGPRAVVLQLGEAFGQQARQPASA